MEIKLIEQWDEDTNITWWRKSRKKLNKIIRKFNKWQIKHKFDTERADIVLAYIELGIKTIGSQDGGGGYLQELEKMKLHVLDIKSQQQEIV